MELFVEFQPPVLISGIVAAMAGIDYDGPQGGRGAPKPGREDRAEHLFGIAPPEHQGVPTANDRLTEEETQPVESNLNAVQGDFDGRPLAAQPHLFPGGDPLGGEAEAPGEVAGVDIVRAIDPHRRIGGSGGVEPGFEDGARREQEHQDGAEPQDSEIRVRQVRPAETESV